RVRLAPPVARGRFAHEARVETVLHVAAQDAVLDEHVAARRRALVVDVERAAAIGDRAVVHHGDELGDDLLTDASGERGDAFAVEIALQAVPDRFVEQDAGPAWTEHHCHRARRRVHGRELERGLPRGLDGEALPALGLEVEVERHAATAAEAADLALAGLLGDRRHVQPGERSHVAHGPAGRRGDEHHHFLARERDDHLRDTRVGRAARGVDLPQQVELGRQLGDDGRLAERIEVVRATAPRHRDDAGLARAIRDGARLPRRLLEVVQREIVGVRITGARCGLRANPGALTHVARSFFYNVFLEYELLIDAILEVNVRVVDATREVAAE